MVSPEARVALTLRVVGGLTSDEIARAFLVPTATVQARITRAKKTLSAAAGPVRGAAARRAHERLGSVLSVVYVIFTEGSTATSGDDLIRPDLAREAIRLARVLTRLVPDEPEVHGLLALLELTAARFPARTGPDGEPVLLADQDRRRWDRTAIRRGRAALAPGRRRWAGVSAPTACRPRSPSATPSPRRSTETDWDRIVVLYEALGRLAPSPVVELNRAVAVSMAQGPAAGLRLVDELAATGELAGTHLLPSVRGELLTRLGRADEARPSCPGRRALRQRPERALLERKAARARLTPPDATAANMAAWSRAVRPSRVSTRPVSPRSSTPSRRTPGSSRTG